jgi:hypothetical protein
LIHATQRLLAGSCVRIFTYTANAGWPAYKAKKCLKQACFTRNFGSKMAFEGMCREAARLGAVGFDAVPLEQWPILITDV